MTIEKLPSGSYRLSQMENGKRYRITIDHKPSKTEALKLLAEAVDRKPVKANLSLDDAVSAYIDTKANILSPATKREYGNMRRKIPKELSEKHLNAITSIDIQKYVNDLSADLAPKTVKNYSNFIMSVLKFWDIPIKSPNLPQRKKDEVYIPTTEDIQAIQAQFEGTEYEIPFFLLCLGLRRSELCALTTDDLDGCTLTIDKALVLDENKKWVIKQTKTAESTRTIEIPQEIADRIRERGYIYKGHPANLYDNLRRAQDRAGIPHFRLHHLRHFFASYMHDLGYSDKQIQAMGGWKTDNILKTVYQHAMNLEKTKHEMSAQVFWLIRGKSRGQSRGQK